MIAWMTEWPLQRRQRLRGWESPPDLLEHQLAGLCAKGLSELFRNVISPLWHGYYFLVLNFKIWLKKLLLISVCGLGIHILSPLFYSAKKSLSMSGSNERRARSSLCELSQLLQQGEKQGMFREHMPPRILSSITHDNLTFLKNRDVYSSDYYNFIHHLCSVNQVRRNLGNAFLCIYVYFFYYVCGYLLCVIRNTFCLVLSIRNHSLMQNCNLHFCICRKRVRMVYPASCVYKQFTLA